jgi:uncharacterized membrane protein YdjX (TVP38/TMEM64 family)
LKKIYRFLPIIVIGILIIIAIKSGLTHYLNYVSLKKYHLQLTTYVNQHFSLTLALFCLAYILIVVTSIPGATVLTLVGGLLFGSILGTTVVVISATIGATLLMIAIKLAFGEIVTRRIGARVKFMENNFKQNAFFYLLSMRFLPLVPFFILNLAAGIFNMQISTFFIATLIGIIPGSFVYVNIGANLNNVFNQPGDSFSIASFITPNIIIAFSLLAILSLTPLVVQKIRSNRAK